jgi:hypothetical protein
LEAEANKKPGEVYQKLLQVGVDKTQSDKEAKLKKTLTSILLSLVAADQEASFSCCQVFTDE